MDGLVAEEERLIKNCLFWQKELVDCTKKLTSTYFTMLDVQDCKDKSLLYARCSDQVKQEYDIDMSIDAALLSHITPEVVKEMAAYTEIPSETK